MKKSLLIILIAAFNALTASAQDTGFKHCDTDHMWNKYVQSDPSALEKQQQLLDYTLSRILPGEAAKTSGTIQFTIPVVFHIIHNYGPENISKAQVQNAIDIMNMSFQKLNPDTVDVIPLFQPIFADCEIQFRLANIDPDGNCTEGITRTQSDLTYSAGDNVKALVKWPSDKYFNIWVVSHIASGAAGYAYYPGANSNIDGVVILHDYTSNIGTSPGTNYNERSLTHEVGHWLNLRHVWGNSNDAGLASNCSIDDGIFDTPNTIGTIGGCNLNQVTCSTIDNVQNYMDYTSCHKMFTEGQKQWMHSALLSSVGNRNNLHTLSNLIATGTEDNHVQQLCAPIADFSTKTYAVCQGNTVSFNDYSWNADVISRTWIFNGGTPATDTSSNPLITYTTPGIYPVTLIVHSAGGSDTLTRNAIVHVLPSSGTGATPQLQDFETLTIANDWVVQNPDNNNQWAITSAAGFSGTKSARLVNQIGNPAGSVDNLITETYDFSNLTQAQMTFKAAFAAKSSADVSILRVYASTNCGQTWSMRLTKTSTALRTAPNTNGNFIPSTTEWATHTINLTSSIYSGNPSVRFKFEFTNDAGNNFYIDDINITGLTGLNDELNTIYNFSAFPNPAKNEMQIKIEREFPESVQLELTDMLGRRIEITPEFAAQSGTFNYTLLNKGYNGMYLLRVHIGGRSFQSPVIFID